MDDLKKSLLQGEKSLAIYGAGFIGYCNSVFFARQGVSSLLIDIDEDKVNKINIGEPPYPELASWVGFDLKPVVHLIKASTDWRKTLSDKYPVQFICVNTEKDIKPDLAPLTDVCYKIAKAKPQITIVESTLAPTWTDKIIRPSCGDIPIALAPRRDWFTCYSEDTEILTERGWINFSELNKEDKVAVLKDDYLSFEKPIDTQCFNYEGKMYHAKSVSINLLVTPNHQLYVHPYKKPPLIEANRFGLFKVEDVMGLRMRIKKDAKWVGIEKDKMVLPSVKWNGFYKKIIPDRYLPMDDWLEFFGYWLAEGHVSKEHGKEYFVIITQWTDEKRKKMFECTKRIFPNAKEYCNGKARKITICDKQLYEYLKQFGKCDEKYIPRDILDLHPDKLKILLNAMMLGDGHGSKDRWVGYATTSKRLADNVSEILLKIGLSSTTSVINSHYQVIRGQKYLVKTIYKIVVIHNKLRPRINSYILGEHGKRYHHDEWVDYKGMVYCCTTSTGVIYVRRGGKQLWCGNCPGMSVETLDRVVGATSPEALDLAVEVLSIISKKIHRASSYRVVELVKAVENAYRHLDVTFAYQLALAFPNLNVREVLRLVGTKWNMNEYFPSIGIAGYCLNLAPRYILSSTEHKDTLFLLDESLKTEASMVKTVVEYLYFKGMRNVRVLGIAYKGNLKVHIGSAGVRLAKMFKEYEVEVKVNDPLYSDDEVKRLSNCEAFKFPEELKGCDCIVITCDHDYYRTVFKDKFFPSLEGCKYILDCFGIWSQYRDKFKEMGIEYHEVGDEGWID